MQRVRTKKFRQAGKLAYLQLRWRGSNTFSPMPGDFRWDMVVNPMRDFKTFITSMRTHFSSVRSQYSAIQESNP